MINGPNTHLKILVRSFLWALQRRSRANLWPEAREKLRPSFQSTYQNPSQKTKRLLFSLGQARHRALPPGLKPTKQQSNKPTHTHQTDQQTKNSIVYGAEGSLLTTLQFPFLPSSLLSPLSNSLPIFPFLSSLFPLPFLSFLLSPPSISCSPLLPFLSKAHKPNQETKPAGWHAMYILSAAPA